MLSRLVRAQKIVILATVVMTAAGLGWSQEQTDRPPWARSKPKAKSASRSSASSTSGSTTSATNPGTTTTNPTPPVDPGDGSAIPAQKSDTGQGGRIRVSVNLVNVLVSVLDDNNRPAPDLPVEAFQLFEEGVKQKIDIFEQETKEPLDIALMVDASLSAHKEISFEQDAAAHFIGQVLRTGDALAVYSFDEDVRQIAGFSDNAGALQSAVHKVPPGAGTSIYDAVVLGSRALERRASERRRVIILVTDGGETTSRADFEAARKAALHAGTLMYTIIVRPVKNENGRNTAGEHALEAITDTTGGAIFYPDGAQDLDIIFDRIDRELRTQYRLGYYPNPRGPANSYRNIEVKVLDNYKARHRKTYLTGAQ